MNMLSPYEYAAAKHFVENVNNNAAMQQAGIEAGLLGYRDKSGTYYFVDLFVKGTIEVSALVLMFNNYTSYTYRTGFRVQNGRVPNDTLIKSINLVDGSFCHLATRYTINFKSEKI